MTIKCIAQHMPQDTFQKFYLHRHHLSKIHLSGSEILMIRAPVGQTEQRACKSPFTGMKKNSCFPYRNKMLGIFFYITAFLKILLSLRSCCPKRLKYLWCKCHDFSLLEWIWDLCALKKCLKAIEMWLQFFIKVVIEIQILWLWLSRNMNIDQNLE